MSRKARRPTPRELLAALFFAAQFIYMPVVLLWRRCELGFEAIGEASYRRLIEAYFGVLWLLALALDFRFARLFFVLTFYGWRRR